MIDLLKQRETIEKTKNKLMNMSEASFYQKVQPIKKNKATIQKLKKTKININALNSMIANN